MACLSRVRAVGKIAGRVRANRYVSRTRRRAYRRSRAGGERGSFASCPRAHFRDDGVVTGLRWRAPTAPAGRSQP